MDDKAPTIAAGKSIASVLNAVADYFEHSNVYFGHGTDNAWDEAVQLVMGAAGLPANSGEDVLGELIDAVTASRISSLVSTRVIQQIPLPYLLEKAWFAGLEFKCDRRAIIPRSPMAELVLNAFEPWVVIDGPLRVLDLCCGGGSIGLAVAYYFPNARVELVDLDEDAVALARENAVLLGVEDRVTIYPSDLFSAVAEDAVFDIVLSNPPYVNAADLSAMPAEYHHEPAMALGSGEDGLNLTHQILARAGDFLAPGGSLFVELGYSWPALELAYPLVPFTWLEFEQGGEGVFTLTAEQWQHYSESWRR
ncbi:MAG: 50S ribosomal protein L3 N(5)-glutamine methyltransferase [Halioglobus sp.]